LSDVNWQKRAVCPANVVATFAAQLSIMLTNGVSIVDALDILRIQHEYPNFGVIVGLLSKELYEGRPLSAAARDYPRVFPPVFCALVSVGETTGNLAVALDKAASWMKRDYEAVKGVKTALVYPVFVFLFSAILTLLLFYTVLPQFLTMFDGLGIELPWITKVVLAITKAVRLPGFWILTLVLALAVVLGLREGWADPKGRLMIYTVLLRVPVVGRILQASSMARFSSALQLTAETGQSMPSALALSAAASGNPLVEHDSPKLIAAITQGQSLAEYMACESEIYPRILIQMIEVGEQAADIPEMVSRAGEFFEEEAKVLIDSLGVLVEPIMLGGVAVVVGTVLVSIFLPLYSIVGKMSM
jgi:type IV pilus assembly protein PilC